MNLNSSPSREETTAENKSAQHFQPDTQSEHTNYTNLLEKTQETGWFTATLKVKYHWDLFLHVQNSNTLTSLSLKTSAFQAFHLHLLKQGDSCQAVFHSPVCQYATRHGHLMSFL